MERFTNLRVILAPQKT